MACRAGLKALCVFADGGVKASVFGLDQLVQGCVEEIGRRRIQIASFRCMSGRRYKI